MRRAATMLLLVLVAAGLTAADCGEDEEDSGGGTVSISGTWTSSFDCESSSGAPFSGEETLVITQSGNRVEFTASDGSTGVGTVSANRVTWNSTGPGYTETGTWTILDAVSMTKRSTYTNNPSVGGGGTCSGSLQKAS
jgi:hypothetical protein